MKIIYHHRTQGSGAEGVHIREIINAFEELETKVFVINPPGINVLADIAHSKANTWNRFTWHLVSNRFPQWLFETFEFFYNFIAIINLSWVIFLNKIDFIYERYSFFCFSGVLCSRLYKIPLILEVNEISGLKRVRSQRCLFLSKKIEKFNYTNSNAIIVVSEFLKEQIISLGISRDKIFVLPNAVNEKFFHPGVKISEQLVNTLKLKNKIVVGFVGGLVHWHNFNFLLDVFEDIVINNLCLNIILLFVGSGNLEVELKKQVKDRRLNDNVIFAGEVSNKEVPRFIKLMDICLIPHSNQFRSPIKMFEYMSLGKPVVAPDLQPVTLIIKDGVNGFVFTPNDKASFKQKILRLVRNKETRGRVGLNAARTIFLNHTWKVNALKIIEIYKKTCLQ